MRSSCLCGRACGRQACPSFALAAWPMGSRRRGTRGCGPARLGGPAIYACTESCDCAMGSAPPAHATLAQPPAAGADALKDLRAQRAQDIR
eukprot:COSAG01_NODE_369_length_18046_cov_130.301443_11_plen_91_part_00